MLKCSPERVIAAVRMQTALFQTSLQFAAVCTSKNLTQRIKSRKRSYSYAESAGAGAS